MAGWNLGKIRACLAMVFVLDVLAAPGAEVPDKVGPCGDLRTVIVQGSHAFASQQILDALWRDLDVQIALDPDARLADLLRTMEDRTTLGYRKAGYPSATVAARRSADGKRIELWIDEGRLLLANDVVVVGAQAISSEALATRLTRRRPSREAPQPWQGPKPDGTAEADRDDALRPIWQRGRPAPLDDASVSSFTSDIREVLADLGFYTTVFTAAVVPDGNRETASLRVQIQREGPRAVMGELRVSGNRRDSTADISKYLGIVEGMPLDRADCRSLQRRLAESGRFRKCDISATPIANSDAFALKIEVQEYDRAPPLLAALSQAEETLLRCRRWALDAASAGDLVYRNHSGRWGVETVISLDHGMLFGLSLPGADGAMTRSQSLLLTPGEAAWYDHGRQRKFAVPVTIAQLWASYSLQLSNERYARQEGNLFEHGVQIGFSSLDVGDSRPPFQLRLRLEPSLFLALAHEDGPQVSVKKGVLTIHGEKRLLRLDLETGRPLTVAFEKGPQIDPDRAAISAELGALARRAKTLRSETAEQANAFDPRRPFTSFGQFAAGDEALWQLVRMVNEDATTDRINPRWFDVWRKLLGGGILRPFDAIERLAASVEREEFSLPISALQKQFGFQGMLAAAALYLSDVAFPRESWPWELARDAALTTVGRNPRPLTDLVARYSSADRGPVCCLAAASVMKLVSPPASAEVARRGLTRLTLDDFRRDYRFLLQADHPLAPYFDDALKAIAGLDEADMAVVTSHCSADHAGYVRAGWEAIQRRAGQPAAAVIPEVLDAVWLRGLKAVVGQQLETLAGIAVPRTSSQPNAGAAK